MIVKKIISSEDVDSDSDDFYSDSLIQKKIHAVTEYIINLDDDIESPKEYRRVYEILRNAYPIDYIRFVINSYGGDVYTFIQLFNYMMKTPATTIAELHSAYSAGAMLALSCDIIELQDFSSMMIHDMSSNSFGKMTEIVNHVDFMKRWGNEIIDTIYSDFLTEKELQDIKNGKDIWFTQKQIEKKLKKWICIRGRK